MNALSRNELLLGLTTDSPLEAIVEAVTAEHIGVPGQCIKYSFTEHIQDGISFSVATDRTDHGLLDSILQANSICEQLSDFAVLLNNVLRREHHVVKATTEFYHAESDHECATHKFCLQIVAPGQDLFNRNGDFLRKEPDVVTSFYLTR